MNIAEIMKAKAKRVTVSIPAKMQKLHPKLGETAKGKVLQMKRVPRKPRLVRVVVVIKGKSYEFRPQDVHAA
jgi:hypothetical protein